MIWYKKIVVKVVNIHPMISEYWSVNDMILLLYMNSNLWMTFSILHWSNSLKTSQRFLIHFSICFACMTILVLVFRKKYEDDSQSYRHNQGSHILLWYLWLGLSLCHPANLTLNSAIVKSHSPFLYPPPPSQPSPPPSPTYSV